MNYGFTIISRAGQSHPKLDPRLASLVELSDEAFGEIPPPTSRSGFESTRDVPLRRTAGPLAFLKGPLAGKKARSGPESKNEALRGGYDGPAARVPIFIKVKSHADFNSLGVKLGSKSGTIATAFLTVDEIIKLEALDAVVAMEWTGGAAPVAQPYKGSDGNSPRKTLGMVPWDSALDGRGTLIGIVDAGGIDLYHPDLVDEGNVSKVRWIWDQTVEGRNAKPPPEWDYGHEYTPTDLFMELDPNRPDRYSTVNHQAEKQSHATAVAGIAAGLGGENENARGVAPGAQLIYVGTHGSRERALATMTELAEAVDYVFNRADQAGKPCVVNVSLGDDLGPRDGTSPVELFFDSLLEKPGRAIVVAAGNSAEKKRHVSGKLGGTHESGKGRDLTDRLAVYIARDSGSRLVIEVWFNTGTAPSIEVVAPHALGQTERLSATDPPHAFSIPNKGPSQTPEMGPYGEARTHVLISGADPYPGSNNGLLRVEIFAAFGTEILEGKWEIVLHAHPTAVTEWHAWLDHPSSDWDPNTKEADVTTTITSPATSRSAISVGAYVHTDQQAAYFSGRGPGRQGLQKPDLIACGTAVCSISASTPARYTTHFSGTSAAAPQVAGAVALLFQHLGKNLTAHEIKEHLLQMADVTNLTAPNPITGFGRAAMSGLPGRKVQDVVPHDEFLTRLNQHSAAHTAQTSTNNPSQGNRPMSMQADQITQPTKHNNGPRGDRVQIIDGLYDLIQADVVVGKLLVVPGANQNKSTEHWGLLTAYRWPSVTNSNQEIRFVYRDVYTATTPAAFKQSLPSGSTYIVAECNAEIV